MVFIFIMIIAILCFTALSNASLTSSKRALLGCSKIIIAFIKSAQVLFGEVAAALVSIYLIHLAFNNHFVIDYYILFLFSSMILIIYHILKMARCSSAIS